MTDSDEFWRDLIVLAVVAVVLTGAVLVGIHIGDGHGDARGYARGISECHTASLAGQLAAEKKTNADLTAQIAHQAASVRDTERLRKAISASTDALQGEIKSVTFEDGCTMPSRAVELLNEARE